MLRKTQTQVGENAPPSRNLLSSCYMISAYMQLVVRVGELPAPAHGPAPLADRGHPLPRRRLHHLALPRHPPGCYHFV